MDDFKIKVRSLCRELIYVGSSCAVFFSGLRNKSRHTLLSLKNQYKGQRCFIVGNGPSLTPEDLDDLKGEVTFAANRVYKMFEKTDWRPTYYAIFDESVARDKDLPGNVNQMDTSVKFFREQGWYVYRKIKNGCYIHSWHSRKYLETPQFSEDIVNGIYTIASVTYAMIQIARYMGFSEIYLIGMDHRYATERAKDGSIINHAGVSSYFGQTNKAEAKVVGASWEMEIAYQYAQDYSVDHGFRIYNATRGGFLEVFERVNLDDVLMKQT